MRTRGKDFEYRLVFPMEERARSYESRASRLAALVQPERRSGSIRNKVRTQHRVVLANSDGLERNGHLGNFVCVS
jgi:hypothetical protein